MNSKPDWCPTKTMAEYAAPSVGQVAFLLGMLPVLTGWLYAEFLEIQKHRIQSTLHSDIDFQQLGDNPNDEEKLSVNQQLMKFFSLDVAFLLESRLTLRSIAEFVGLLLYLFVCDRTSIFPESERSYNRDLFMFLYLLLIIASSITSLKKHVDESIASRRHVLYLNRHQTEEWKGWMQVLFLMYHYFAAKEIYNAIRIFIAGYVWMTGFGNFSYYYVRKDFSLGRFFQMMWRLNFLVTFCCIVLENSYMLYYICPMHTFFTLMVYCSLGVFHKYNENHSVIAIKIAACFAVVIVIWEIPGVFEIVWYPFTFLLGIYDPKAKAHEPLLYMWKFYSSLDRYIWIYGMICAFFHPTVERWLEKLEELDYRIKTAIRGAIIGICLVVGYLWYIHVYKLDSSSYIHLHPYTSWIPISVYICLRNISQPLRNWSLALFAWLGKITLETYIIQFHILLRTGIPNTKFNHLLSMIPDYPMLNLLLTSSIYLLVAYRLFELNGKLKSVFVPNKDDKRLLHIALFGALICLSLYAISFILLKILPPL